MRIVEITRHPPVRPREGWLIQAGGKPRVHRTGRRSIAASVMQIDKLETYPTIVNAQPQAPACFGTVAEATEGRKSFADATDYPCRCFAC